MMLVQQGNATKLKKHVIKFPAKFSAYAAHTVVHLKFRSQDLSRFQAAKGLLITQLNIALHTCVMSKLNWCTGKHSSLP